ncbi:MAG TPA: DUF2085 domain-containing protein [Pyrinomonadaceae bacterium]|jgi:uncharacterized membrane protein
MPASLYGYVPQCVKAEQRLEPRGRALAVWVAVVAGGLLFVASITGAPLALAGGHTFYAEVIYRGFRFACHQMPERSFYLAGHPLAVCARCTGIYAGFAVAALGYPLVRSMRRVDTPGRVWLLAASLPLAVDFALGFFGVWENTHLSRFATGALVGAVSVFYVVPSLLDLVCSRRWRDFFSFEAAREKREKALPRESRSSGS